MGEKRRKMSKFVFFAILIATAQATIMARTAASNGSLVEHPSRPALFGSDVALSDVHTVVVADPIHGCQPLNNPDHPGGNVALLFVPTRFTPDAVQVICEETVTVRYAKAKGYKTVLLRSPFDPPH